MGKHRKMDISVRYKKSIFLDAFIMFFLIILLLIISGIISGLTDAQLELFYMPVIIFSLSQNVFQDFIFHRSIGKKFYKIKIVTDIKSKRLLLKSLIIRRVLEGTYNPFLKMDFNALSYKMDVSTLTKIVDEDQ